MDIKKVNLISDEVVNQLQAKITELGTVIEMLDKACGHSMALNKKYNNIEVENERLKEGIERLIIEYGQMLGVKRYAIYESVYKIFINDLKELGD